MARGEVEPPNLNHFAEVTGFGGGVPGPGQLDPVLLVHLTVSYRINRRRKAHESVLKGLSLTGYKDYYDYRYNCLTGQTDPEREANIVPNISCRIEC